MNNYGIKKCKKINEEQKEIQMERQKIYCKNP